MLELVIKKCQNPECKQTWKALESDKTEYCSKNCKYNTLSVDDKKRLGMISVPNIYKRTADRNQQ